MSILDKASLIQIPSGYKSTKLYSLRPINGDGDFDFSRSSSATRVNSEGLIETASVLGSELVTNGDFSDGSTDWNLVGDFVVSGGSASITSASQYSQLTNQLGVNYLLSGKKYKLEFDIPTLSISNAFAYRYTGGSVTPISTSDIVNGKFTTEFTMSTNGYFWLQTTGSFTGLNVEVDNVSVKEVFENDVPRLDYSGGASCASLLLEGQRTNTLLYSEDFTQGVFTNASSSSTSENCMTFGSAIELIEDTANNVHGYTFDDRSGSTNDYVTSSYYVKKNTRTKIRIYNYYLSNQNAYADWDLNTKTLINSGATNMTFVSSNLFDLSDGWVKLEITSIKSTSTYSYHARIQMLDNSGNASYVGDGSSSIFVRAAQTELAAQYSTSYIPTSGSTVTRTADVCNNAGTSATFNSTEGVLFVEMAALANDGTNRQISLNNGTTNDRIQLYFSTSTNQITVFYKAQAGTTSFIFNETLGNATSFNKIAFKWKTNDFALWVNGVETDTLSSGVTPLSNVLNNLDFNQFNAVSPFYGKTKQLMVFDEALSDEELSDLTGQVNLSFNNLATFYGYTIL